MGFLRSTFTFLLVALSASMVHAQTRERILQKLKGRAPELIEQFKRMDKNSDQKLTSDELGNRLFDFFNVDGNDFVDREEVTEAIKQKGLEAFQNAMKNRNSEEAMPIESQSRPRAESAPSQRENGASDASKLSEVSASAATSSNSLQEGPKRLVPGEHGVGKLVPDLKMTDIDGKSFQLSELTASGKLLVIAFTNSTCPVCKKYGPTLGSLEDDLRGSVEFLFVNPTPSDKLDDIRKMIAAQGFEGHYVRDTEGSIAMILGAMKTTDVFLLDSKRTLLYRGAVDDQYGFGYSIEVPKRQFLLTAVKATLAGETVAMAATSAPGCPLNLMQAKPVAHSEISYHNRISRIVQNRCLECHRDGGVAPFAMSNYSEVAGQAGAIRQVLERGVMPPWFAAAPIHGEASPFINDASLSATEKADFMAWLDSGLREGDSGDAPLERKFNSDWQIGEPDLVIQVNKPIKVKASGTMPYQMVSVETGLTEDKYLQGIEVRPTAREVVHHILVFVAPGNESARTRFGARAGGEGDDEDETNGFFAAYAPGYDALNFNEGFGKVLPAGSKLRFQIHYTPNGTATEDQPMIGMKFCKEKPAKLLDVVGISQVRLAIPPNDANHEVVATQILPKEATVLAFFPHMHLRGKAFKYEAFLPNGESKVLLEIPRYDFNWQLSYRLAEPITLPQGTKIQATAWYDNSSGNLANPDPNRTVRWGPQTTDEMMIGYIEYHMEGATMGRGRQFAELRDRLRQGFDPVSLLDRFDIDKDGSLSKSEVPEQAGSMLMRLDQNKDSKITRDELERLKDLRLRF